MTLVAVLACGAAAGIAQAQKGQPAPGDTVSQVSAEMVGEMLAQNGLQYTITRDSWDDPMIQVTTGKSLPAQSFVVFFYDCDTSDRCEDLMLAATFPARGGVTAVNAWNSGARWVRAYMQEDQTAVLEMDLNATGGIGYDNVRIMVNTYVGMASEFAAAVNP